MKKKYTSRNTSAVKNSGYADGGAGHSKPALKDYHPVKKSAKSDIDANLSVLRNRASDLTVNTPIGSAVISTSAQYVVGAGLKVFPKVKADILGMTDEAADEWNKKTAQEFDLWASSKYADIRKRNNFYDLQEMLYKAYLTDGDSFAIFRRDYDQNMPYTLRIQALEGNRVSNPLGASEYNPVFVEAKNYQNGNRIINGVEINDTGATVAYWISNKVPLDPTEVNTAIKWARVEAEGPLCGKPNVMQICHDERPEQYRGVPYLAPVIETLKQVSRYTSAELTSAIMKSFFSIFFTSAENQHSIDDLLPSEEGMDEDEPVCDPSEYKLGPGTVNALPRGVDVKSIDQSNAQSTFEPFTKELIKQVAAALGQPYEVIMKCFGSSYSASRAALLQAWDQYKLRREWFARDFCQPVYEMWLIEAIANGRVEAPGFFDDPMARYAYSNAEWYGPSMSILDPVKDINGAILRIQTGLSTPEREAAEMTGSNFEENIKVIKRNYAQMINAGINPPGVKTTGGGEEDEGKEVLEPDNSRGAGSSS